MGDGVFEAMEKKVLQPTKQELPPALVDESATKAQAAVVGAPPARFAAREHMTAEEDWNIKKGIDGIDPEHIDDAVSQVKKLGTGLFKEGKWTEAAAWFSKGLKLKEDAALYSNRSACYCVMKDYKKALTDADRAIYFAPGWGKGYARKGAALHGLKYYAHAIEVFDEGIKMDPSATKVLQAARADAVRAQQLAGGSWDSTVAQSAKLHCPGHLLVLPDGSLCIRDEENHYEREPGQLKIVSKKSEHHHPVLLRSIELVGPTNDRNQDHFHNAMGITHDDAGGLYAVDSEHCRIVKFRLSTGEHWATFKKYGCRQGELDRPRGICFSPHAGGRLYVTDWSNNRVVLFDTHLNWLSAFGRFGWDEGELRSPDGVAVDGTHLAVADTGNDRVCVYTLDGVFLRALGMTEGAGKLRKPRHVSLEGGRVYVVEEPDPPHVSETAKKEEPTLAAARVVVFTLEGAHVRDLYPPDCRNHEKRGMLRGLAVSPAHVYVSNGQGNCSVLRLDNPFAPPMAVDVS